MSTANEAKPSSKPSAKQIEDKEIITLDTVLNSEKSEGDIIPGIRKDAKIGVRGNSNQKLIGTGANLKEYEKFLVRPSLEVIPPAFRGAPPSSKVNGVQIVERTMPPKKIEPELVVNLNSMIIFKEKRTPFQYLFPKGSVEENQKLKATSIELMVPVGNSFTSHEFLFIEYKGTKTLKEQIRDKKIELNIIKEEDEF